MVALYPVGKSSFDDYSSTSPNGQTQYVLSASVAAQVASLAVEFDKWAAKKPGKPRLTVNEGVRSRDRQDALYAQYKRDGVPLAAYPYTSTHDHTRGSALDFGVTYEDGTNGALASVDGALRWMQLNGPTRGIRPTGLSFWQAESWHYNGGYAPAKGPIKNAPQPGTATKKETAAAAAVVAKLIGDDDMKPIWSKDGSAALLVLGSDRYMADKTTAKVDGLDGLAQAKLFERAARIDVAKPYGGSDLTVRELQNLAHIIGAIKKGYSA